MKIIPAIDIYNNNCVRLYKGKFNKRIIFSKNPYKIVNFIIKNKIKKIHLIDLNRAKNRSSINLKCIKKILKLANKNNIKVQIGGGIRKIKDIINLLNWGANNIILSTSIINNKINFKGFKELKKKIIVSIDIVNCFVYSKGWLNNTKLKIDNFIKSIKKKGFNKIIITDINKDGTLQGLNIKLIIFLLSKKIDFYISGGLKKKKQVLFIKNKYKFKGIICGNFIYLKKNNIKFIKKINDL
ncbi:HisA/HisF-related TIM barrel protein [Candidatus Vidania fulgoroideorum]